MFNGYFYYSTLLCGGKSGQSMCLQRRVCAPQSAVLYLKQADCLDAIRPDVSVGLNNKCFQLHCAVSKIGSNTSHNTQDFFYFFNLTLI